MSRGFSSALQPGRPWKSILASYQVLFLLFPSLLLKCQGLASSLPSRPKGPPLPIYLLTRVPACLPSLRPILLAIFGDSAFTTSQQPIGNVKELQAEYPGRPGQDLRAKAPGESYMRMEEGTIRASGSREGSRDILVRHDVSVVGGKGEE